MICRSRPSTVWNQAAAQRAVVIPDTACAAIMPANAEATTPAKVTIGIATTIPQTSGVSR